MSENPKAAFGNAKLDYSTVPEISLLYLTAAHDLGAVKYGAHNWVNTRIKASHYVAAIRRHVAQYAAGEDIDEESGLPNLACAMAGASILIDAGFHGALDDDRATATGFTVELQRLAGMKAGWVAAKAARDAAKAA